MKFFLLAAGILFNFVLNQFTEIVTSDRKVVINKENCQTLSQQDPISIKNKRIVLKIKDEKKRILPD